MAQRDLPPLPLPAQMTDSRGVINPIWAAWFRELFYRVGGHAAKTNLELDIWQPGSITTEMLADGAVTEPKLASSAVTEDKLADDSVTGDKIVDGTITIDKLSGLGALSGQVIRYDGSSVLWDDVAIGAAAAGTMVTDGNGNTELSLSSVPTDLVIQDSSLVSWRVKIGNDGILYTESPTALSTTTPFKIQKPDTSYGQIGVNTDGSLYVTSTPTATAVDNSCYLQSPDGTLWVLAISNSNEIYTVSSTGNGDRFSIVDSLGNIFWQIRSLTGHFAIQYLRVLSAAELTVATPPPTVTGCLPMAFYNNGSNTRLIFWDGAAWKYVHDNSAA